MTDIPKKFQVELDEMDRFYSTIQELRQFKDYYDAQLVNKCQRDNLGSTTGYYPWSFVSGSLGGQLREKMHQKG